MARSKILRRILRMAWKLALLAVIAGGVVYYLRFRPVPVKAFIVKSDTVYSEVMGTGTHGECALPQAIPKNAAEKNREV